MACAGRYSAMAYDEELADRVRGCLGAAADGERRMFGGLAFLVGGHMALAVSGSGGLMVRCDPDDSEVLLTEPGATRMVMQGRELAGWLLVDADALADDAALERWAAVGATYAGGLPPK